MRKIRAIRAVAVLLSMLAAATTARAEPLKVRVEPLVGFEHVEKFAPTTHFRNRIMYGALVTVGLPLLAVESEYTHGTDTESFPDQSLSEKDTDEKVKLGVRAGYRLGGFVSLLGRVGGQAKRNTHEETLSGVASTSTGAITYKPYAGAEFTLGLTNMLSATAGVLVVFNDIHHMDQNEYQTTAGFSLRLL